MAANGSDEGWLDALKRAYDAGYYRTEVAEAEQESFPWQGRTCSDCPFWVDAICLVHAEKRAASAHTCRYFDRPNREAGRALVQRRRWELLRRRD